MFSTHSLLLASLASGLALSSPVFIRQNQDTYPDPQPCSGACGGVHDPTVIKRDCDGTYFRISTLDNLALASAPSLGGPWTQLGSALPQGSSIHVQDDQELWAPDVFKINNTYYSYYAVSKLGIQTSQIGLMSSPTMDLGSWTDHGSVNLPQSPDYNLIDPNHFFDSDGSPYTNFGSGWNGIYQVPGELAFNNDVSPILEISNSTDPIGSTSRDIVEGSYEFAWIGAYWMFFSSGYCCNAANDLAPAGEEYKIMVCRSDNASGPFIDQEGKNCATENGGSLLLGSHGKNVYAPGGQGVMFDDDAVVLYYHYVNPTIGYDFQDFQFGYNHLDFSSGWPVVTP